MIRSLIFCAFFSASMCVFAQPLYKWVESDGSITFSVKRPPAGVDYETINSSKENDAQTPAAADSVSAREAEAVQKMLPRALTTEPAQRLAPQLGIQADDRNRAGEQNDAQNTQPVQAASESSGVVSSNSQEISDRRAAMSANSRKQRQCEDLKKRVISLERRLKTRLTPDDMDNTVVHMARYQQSYDHHCVQ